MPMPIIFKPDELDFKWDKFNSDRFNLLTALPNEEAWKGFQSSPR
jgi:hypothetical protein